MFAVHPETPPVALAQPEIHAMNREFLALVTATELPSGQPVCGLEAAIVEQLRELESAQLDALAAAPVLLADFALLPGRDVAEAATDYQLTEFAAPESWGARVRDFAHCLLTSVWQLSRQPAAAAGFCLGLDERCLETLAGLDFGELLGRAESVCQTLRAVHADHPRCWPALIAAAASDDAERLAAARLNLIPVTVAQLQSDP